MDPLKAFRLGVDPDEVKVESFSNKYGGDWIVFVPDIERGRRVLFSTADLFEACGWRAQLLRLAGQ